MRALSGFSIRFSVGLCVSASVLLKIMSATHLMIALGLLGKRLQIWFTRASHSALHSRVRCVTHVTQVSAVVNRIWITEGGFAWPSWEVVFPLWRGDQWVHGLRPVWMGMGFWGRNSIERGV